METETSSLHSKCFDLDCFVSPLVVVVVLFMPIRQQLDEREAQTKKSLDSGAAGMRALNERNKTFNVHTDTHVGRKKRLAEAKARWAKRPACTRRKPNTETMRRAPLQPSTVLALHEDH